MITHVACKACIVSGHGVWLCNEHQSRVGAHTIVLAVEDERLTFLVATHGKRPKVCRKCVGGLTHGGSYLRTCKKHGAKEFEWIETAERGVWQFWAEIVPYPKIRIDGTPIAEVA